MFRILHLRVVAAAALALAFAAAPLAAQAVDLLASAGHARHGLMRARIE